MPTSRVTKKIVNSYNDNFSDQAEYRIANNRRRPQAKRKLSLRWTGNLSDKLLGDRKHGVRKGFVKCNWFSCSRHVEIINSSSNCITNLQPWLISSAL